MCHLWKISSPNFSVKVQDFNSKIVRNLERITKRMVRYKVWFWNSFPDWVWRGGGGRRWTQSYTPQVLSKLHLVLLLLLGRLGRQGNIYFFPLFLWWKHIVFPWKVFSLEQFPPFYSFRGIYSMYEVKNCHNAETIH